ncbi:hypothetical protein [Haloplanus sp. C73]|uniref:hypothetical protein n=1 Tax=Haloplanus sp. C73 TaxID=3421641 RepID=UPI003EC12530
MSAFYRLVQDIYNRTIRDYLPRTWAIYRGVSVKNARLLDLEARDPDYKQGLLDAIHEHVEGQEVEIVGLGRGVSAIHAVWAGATHVTGYEAASEMIREAETTLEVNKCDRSRISVEHALVGEAVNVFGSAEGAKRISPADLATGDVLILDAEGAELQILDGLGTWPTTVIVETHPAHGAPTDAVVDRLTPEYSNVETRQHKPGAPPEKQVVVASRTPV